MFVHHTSFFHRPRAKVDHFTQKQLYSLTHHIVLLIKLLCMSMTYLLIDIPQVSINALAAQVSKFGLLFLPYLQIKKPGENRAHKVVTWC